MELGVSPRGALFLDRMAKARAFLEGRDYVTGGDVRAVFQDVCAHRVLLKENVREAAVEQVLEELLKKVENPDRSRLFPGMKKSENIDLYEKTLGGLRGLAAADRVSVFF